MWLLIKWYSLLSTRNLIRSKQNKIIKMVTCMSIHISFTSSLLSSFSRLVSLSLSFSHSLLLSHTLNRALPTMAIATASIILNIVRKIIHYREEAPANLFHKFIWIYGVFVACKHSWLVSFSPNSCRLNIAHMPSSFIQSRVILTPSPLHII